MLASLKPSDNVQKILLSSPSKFVGEYEDDNLLFTHAFNLLLNPRSRVRDLPESPTARYGFIVAFRTEPTPTPYPGMIVQNYFHYCDMFCAYLSVLYGKRFDSHGMTEHYGIYHTPDLHTYNDSVDKKLPFNSSQSRETFSVPLNLSEIEVILPLLTSGEISKQDQDKFYAASKFYMKALQNAEEDSETAYLALITASEIISSFFNFNADELIHESTLTILKDIETKMEDGFRIARILKNQFKSIKKSFTKSMISLVDESFYTKNSNKHHDFSIENISSSISAAYDLRSKYVHTGVSFGPYISRFRDQDIVYDVPAFVTPDFKKIISKAPTLKGLERLVRHCLLNLMHQKGLSGLAEFKTI